MGRRQPVSDRVAIGIDVAERRGSDLVALDARRRVIANHGRLAPADAAELVMELRPGMVCIDSPSGWCLSGRSRLAERRLAALGISAFPTGPDPGDHPFYRWMRVGMSLFRTLAPWYPLFAGGPPAGTAAEVFPNASAILLAGGRAHAGETKIAFRRRVLDDFGVDQGALPNMDRVDAALAALTGVLALEGCFSVVGDAEEGVILLPVAELPSRIPRTSSRRGVRALQASSCSLPSVAAAGY